MIKAIYSRFGNMEESDCESHESAKAFLSALEDDGQGYAIGFFDEQAGIFYISENMDVIGKSRNEILAQKVEALASINIIPAKIEFYQ